MPLSPVMLLFATYESVPVTVIAAPFSAALFANTFPVILEDFAYIAPPEVSAILFSKYESVTLPDVQIQIAPPLFLASLSMNSEPEIFAE